MSTVLGGSSPDYLAQRIRADMRQARIAVSRASLQHGRGSQEHQQATHRWAFRQTILYHLAARCGLRPDDIVLSQVPALCVLEAALTARRLAEAADPSAEFLTATAFLARR
jgi:hypothetical protein